jgi:neutral ceramidase
MQVSTKAAAVTPMLHLVTDREPCSEQEKPDLLRTCKPYQRRNGPRHRTTAQFEKSELSRNKRTTVKPAITTLSTILLLTAAPVYSADDKSATASPCVGAGVGIVDITPPEPIVLAGSPSPQKASAVRTRLYVRALVLSASAKKVAIVTLDTLKYPVEQVQRARANVEQTTGIPAGNVIICASHTHYGPLWSYYKDQLVTPITDAVALAARDLTPCTVGVSKGKAEGLSQCRRVIKYGHAWNRWQLKPDEADRYPAEGPSDPVFDMFALTGEDGKLKAVAYNFACHATNTRAPLISADFPGDVDKHVQEQLGYDVPTLFLTGACGDVNPVIGLRRDLFGQKLGGEILRCLRRLEPVRKPSLSIECREFRMPGREHPEFKEAEIARNWPAQLEHYRKAFEEMKKREQASYPYFITGIRISDDFAIITNANELFCGIGLSIKNQSPFKHTMIAEQTNGAHGYVPTAKAFQGGSYETWFGEHSYLTTKAGEIIERESLDMLNRLKHSP